jgi:beta-mannosidase
MRRVNRTFLACALMVICMTCWCAALPYARDAGRSDSLAGRWHVHGAQGAPADQWADAVDDSGWPLLDVPANWYAAGLDHQGALWYRTGFARAAADEDTMTTLVFEGVDYYADVWLNGVYLGFYEGYFEPFAFDVSSLLRPGTNQLSVRVDSPYEIADSEWSLHKRQIKGVFDHHDTRPGGAWSEHGQDANSGGIWAPVYVRTSSCARQWL